MKLSKTGADLLIKREAERLEAYQDSAGIWTIGVGHVAAWVKEGSKITKEKSRSLFGHDVAWAERAVNDGVSVEITQSQFDSLVSFTFNVGPTAFARSTLLRELNSGNHHNVPHQMMRWDKATVDGKKTVVMGLVNRRMSEVRQWNHDSSKFVSNIVRPDEPTGRPASEVIKTSKTVKSGAAVGAVGLMGGATEVVKSVSEATSSAESVMSSGVIVGSLILIGIAAYIVYNRVQDSKNGRSY